MHLAVLHTHRHAMTALPISLTRLRCTTPKAMGDRSQRESVAIAIAGESDVQHGRALHDDIVDVDPCWD
jgi:hypothetical protein